MELRKGTDNETQQVKQPTIYYKFNAEATLQKYIESETKIYKMHYTLREILQFLKIMILKNDMYDDKNPSIILCNPKLEEALNMKALHVTELRNAILNQMETTTEILQGQPSRTTEPTPSTSQVQPKTQTEENHPRTSPNQNQTKNEQPIINISKQPYDQIRIETIQIIDPNTRFKLKTEFQKILKTVPGANQEQETYSYKEITDLFSKYILERKNTIFDIRNVMVALIKNDPLGKIFNLQAFHRKQVESLIKEQMIPINKNPEATTSRQQMETNHQLNPIIQTTSAINNNQITLPRWYIQNPTPNGFTIIDRTANTAMIINRIPNTTTRRTCLQTETESKEMREKESQQKLKETKDNSSNNEEETTSNSDNETEIEEAYRGECTVQSESEEEEKRPDNAGGGNETETDIEDNYVMANRDIALRKQKTDLGYWAGNEQGMEGEDIKTQGKNKETEETNQIEIEKTCTYCRQINTTRMQYCSRCWVSRKSWLPKRKNPRKRKRETNQRGTTRQEFRNRMKPFKQQSTSDKKEKKEIKEKTNEKMEEEDTTTDDLCILCSTNPINSSFIHGNIGHQISCYKCSKRYMKTENKVQGCPVCRRTIERVVKILGGKQF